MIPLPSAQNDTIWKCPYCKRTNPADSPMCECGALKELHDVTGVYAKSVFYGLSPVAITTASVSSVSEGWRMMHGFTNG
jgi:hypothetical protein